MGVKIAFVGLGNMGTPMVERLIDAGFDVSVYSRTASTRLKLAARGAVAAVDVASAVQHVDLVLTSLPTPEAVKDVYLGVDGIVQAVKPGATVIDLSTIDPQTAVHLFQAFKARGVGFLDAPVSGGVQRAALGTLSIMVGGDADTLRSAESVLRNLGDSIVHVGPAGCGQLVKLCNNMVFAITQVALGEVLVAGCEAGLSTETLFNVLSRSSADSFVLSSYFPQSVFPNARPTLFALDLMAKDIGLFLQATTGGKTPLMISSLARDIYGYCQEAGLGDQDSASVVEFYEKHSNVRLETPK